jgi:hypothetical protein
MGHVVHYLRAIDALMYPVGYYFCNNLLSTSCAARTKCWWIGVKDIFWYLSSTSDLGVFVWKNP